MRRITILLTVAVVSTGAAGCGDGGAADSASDAGQAIGNTLSEAEQAVNSISASQLTSRFREEIGSAKAQLPVDVDAQVDRIAADLEQQVNASGRNEEQIRQAYRTAREKLEALGQSSQDAAKALGEGVKQGYEQGGGSAGPDDTQ